MTTTRYTTALALAALLALGGSLALQAEEAFVTNERGLDRRNMDLEADPCSDFYQYANGKWLERNPVPDEYGSWGTGDELRKRNYEVLRVILEEAAAADAKKGTNERKVGDFWATAMDTKKIETAGLKPLKKDLERIDNLETVADVQALVRDYHQQGTLVLFASAVFPDLKDSEKYIVYAVQAGLGLPDRDYYTRDDDDSVELREKYTTHVANMLTLTGVEKAQAENGAKAILALETRLAEASLTNVELRNPANYYNVKRVAETDELTPNFSWTKYFERLGLPETESFSYAHPKFFKEMNSVLREVPMETWKAYFKFHLATAFAAYLTEDFISESFDFNGRILQGKEKIRPRWKRVVDQTSGSMGEALGQVYVERTFPPETKARADEMIQNLQAAVGDRIKGLEWMGDETKEKALKKLSTFRSKIGYPDEWRDYSRLEIGTDSYLTNIRAANEFEMWRNLDKIGKPIDRNEWEMAPQTVNAYYNPLMNEIVFPAAIMQPPYFDGKADDAVNYGAMGAVIGHELMHGFDDQGSRFDADGNMVNWWTDEDRARFEERTAKLITQFAEYVAVDDLHVNGELTLGENIGDLAGLTMSFYALQKALEKNNPSKIDGFTPEQRFFLSWAQAWRKTYRPEQLKLQVNTDPHSPAMFRGAGPMVNMPEFAAAFGCKAEDPMVRAEKMRADIW